MGWRLQEGVAFDAGSTGDRGSTGDTGNSDDTNVICQSSIVNPVRDDSGDLPVNQVRSRTSLLLTRPQQISIHVHGLLLETRMRCSHCRELLCHEGSTFFKDYRAKKEFWRKKLNISDYCNAIRLVYFWITL